MTTRLQDSGTGASTTNTNHYQATTTINTSTKRGARDVDASRAPGIFFFKFVLMIILLIGYDPRDGGRLLGRGYVFFPLLLHVHFTDCFFSSWVFVFSSQHGCRVTKNIPGEVDVSFFYFLFFIYLLFFVFVFF